MTATLTTELRTIRVYGTLADLIGRRTFQAVVKTVRDAVNFLIANFPQVEAHIKQRHFRVKVSNWTLGEDDLSAPLGVTDEIHIIPAICGAGGNNGVLGILAGIALIGIGLFVPGAGPIFTNLGIGLLLTGISALIAPTPVVPDEENDPSKSYNFSGVQNTSNEGVPVPCVYGEIVTGSVVISLGVIEDEGKIDTVFIEGPGDPNPPLFPFPPGGDPLIPTDPPEGAIKARPLLRQFFCGSIGISYGCSLTPPNEGACTGGSEFICGCAEQYGLEGVLPFRWRVDNQSSGGYPLSLYAFGPCLLWGGNPDWEGGQYTLVDAEGKSLFGPTVDAACTCVNCCQDSVLYMAPGTPEWEVIGYDITE